MTSTYATLDVHVVHGDGLRPLTGGTVRETQERILMEPRGIVQVVADYIAGMTDRYALDEHIKLFEPGAKT